MPSLAALADWCRAARHQLAAGVAVTKMLDRATTTGPDDVRAMSTRMLAAAKDGRPLASALDADQLPPTFVPLFRVGEETGRLPEMLTAIEDDLREEDRFRQQIRSQTLMPRLQFFAAVFIIAGVIWLLGVIAGNGPAPITIFGLSGTTGAILFLAATLGPVLLAWFFARRLLADPMRRGRFNAFLRRVPFVGSCLEALAVRRFARALGCTLDSGLPIGDAVQLAFDASPLIRPHAASVVRSLKQGQTFSESLEGCPLPADFVAILDSAEHAGSVPEAMRHEANRWAEIAGERLTLLARIVSGFVWLAVAAFIIACIFRLAGIYLGALAGR